MIGIFDCRTCGDLFERENQKGGRYPVTCDNCKRDRRIEAQKRFRESEYGRKARKDFNKKYYSNPEVKKIQHDSYLKRKESPGFREHRTEVVRQWRQTESGRLSSSNAVKRYQEKNIDEVRRKNREFLSSPQGKALSSAYKAKRRGSSDYNLWVKSVRFMHEIRPNCAICGCCFNDKFQADHILPLAVGGSNSEDNFQPLCYTCHRQKTNKDMTKIAEFRRNSQEV